MDKIETKREVRQILLETRRLLEEEGWIQGAFYRPGNGYCLAGALNRPEHSGRAWNKAYELLIGLTNAITLTAWNDNIATSRQDVFDLIDRALAA